MSSTPNPTVDKFGRPIAAVDYVPAGPANDVSFGLRLVAPPSALYIQRDDQLVLEGVTVNANDSVQIIVRQLLGAPQYPGSKNLVGAGADAAHQGSYPIVTTQQTLQIPAQNTIALVTIPLVEGYLLSVTVAAGNLGATTRGATYARVWINRGKTQSTNPNAALMLIADYVTQTAPVSWPYGRVLFPTEGPGALSFFPVTNPGAGLEWLFTMAVFNRLRVQGISATFITSATVANRIPRLQIKDSSGNLQWQAATQAVIPASQTVTISAGSVQVSSVADPLTLNWPLPAPLLINAGSTIGTNTTALQAGDVYQTIKIFGELWVDGQ